MALFTQNLKGIGIEVTPKALDGPVIYSKCISSPDKFPLCVYVGWIQDYADAYTFGPPLFELVQLVPGMLQLLAPRSERETAVRLGIRRGHRGPVCGRQVGGMCRAPDR